MKYVLRVITWFQDDLDLFSILRYGMNSFYQTYLSMFVTLIKNVGILYFQYQYIFVYIKWTA